MVVLIIFPVILQTVMNFRMPSIGGQGEQLLTAKPKKNYERPDGVMARLKIHHVSQALKSSCFT